MLAIRNFLLSSGPYVSRFFVVQVHFHNHKDNVYILNRNNNLFRDGIAR
jgi:hypothetical protein